MLRTKPSLIPYTTLFRSDEHIEGMGRQELQEERDRQVAGDERGDRGERGGHEADRALAPDVTQLVEPGQDDGGHGQQEREDRKSTRLNSSHLVISYAVFC